MSETSAGKESLAEDKARGFSSTVQSRTCRDEILPSSHQDEISHPPPPPPPGETRLNVSYEDQRFDLTSFCRNHQSRRLTEKRSEHCLTFIKQDIESKRDVFLTVLIIIFMFYILVVMGSVVLLILSIWL